VALYVDVVGALDPTTPAEPELLERIGALVAAGRHDDAGALLSDDVLARFAFAGTPAEVAAQAEAVLDAGALRVDFGTPHGIDERDGVDLLCREVLPRLRVS
jgi:5,10-methylenetetrahydromethanopterin reductase